MKNLACGIYLTALVALGGCAGPPSTLPMADVSHLKDSQELKAEEIRALLTGKQTSGTVTTAAGYKYPNVIYAFEADGILNGRNPNDWDSGKWHVDTATNRLCSTWQRWLSSCGVVSIKGGKLHFFNPASGGQYLQQ
jgi:hypothetical protein